MIMSWSEAKKLSDIIRNSVVPIECVVKTTTANSTITINGAGFAAIVLNSEPYYSANATVAIDGKEACTFATSTSEGFTFLPFSFNNSLVVNASFTGSASYKGCIRLSAILYDREFIGGGRRKLVPFFSRKAVAA